MNESTRSGLLKAARDVENASLLIACYVEDDTLIPGEVRQLRTLVSKLNDASIQMENIVDRAVSRKPRR